MRDCDKFSGPPSSCYGGDSAFTRVNGDNAIGTLTSDPFLVTYRYICWRVVGWGRQITQTFYGGRETTGELKAYTAIDVGSTPNYTVLDNSPGPAGAGRGLMYVRGVRREGNAASPAYGDRWATQCFDLQANIGQIAQLTLVDSNSAGTWGWAAWDDISCSDTAEAVSVASEETQVVDH